MYVHVVGEARSICGRRAQTQILRLHARAGGRADALVRGLHSEPTLKVGHT
jgi:hypothetical protein